MSFVVYGVPLLIIDNYLGQAVASNIQKHHLIGRGQTGHLDWQCETKCANLWLTVNKKLCICFYPTCDSSLPPHSIRARARVCVCLQGGGEGAVWDRERERERTSLLPPSSLFLSHVWSSSCPEKWPNCQHYVRLSSHKLAIISQTLTPSDTGDAYKKINRATFVTWSKCIAAAVMWAEISSGV